MFRKQYLLILRKITRVLYRFRGVSRLAEMLRRLFARSPIAVEIADYDGTLAFTCRLNEHMGSQIFWRGSYSTDQLRYLDRRITAESVFIDVGANHGEFTLFAAKRARKGKVLSFEPSSRLFKELRDNVERNGLTNVCLFNLGLGDAPGRLPLYERTAMVADGTVHDGLPTLYRVDSRSSFMEEASLTTLDDSMRKESASRADFLKIDVEGAEMSVLRGAEQTIRLCRPVIIIEVAAETCAAAGYSCRELVDYIADQGYSLEIIEPSGRTAPLAPEKLGVFQNVVCLPDKGRTALR